MANDFWKALMEVNPIVILLAIIGAIGLVVYLADLLHKFKDTLGFKTKKEIEDSKTNQVRNCYNAQFTEIQQEITKINEKLDTVTEGNVMTLGDQIERKCRYYIRQGKIPSNEVKFFHNTYDVYKKEHGNHGIDDLFNYCINNIDIVDADETMIKKEEE